MDDIVCRFEEYDAVLVLNKYGYWLRRNSENPGLLIKAVSGIPTKEQAIEHAINCLENESYNGW